MTDLKTDLEKRLMWIEGHADQNSDQNEILLYCTVLSLNEIARQLGRIAEQLGKQSATHPPWD